ncbi:phospholipid-binding protein [Bordetella trematum]|nr:phospholipid-binding protein [Bordetella trematum]AZR95594.1 phospholipid-binding protein [Bordetella trematum]
MMLSKIRCARPLLLSAALAAATASLSACVPLVIGGAAATTAVVATDRRSSGVQLDDQNTTFRVESQIATKLGPTARVNAAVYNGQVLLTGDVPTEAAKAEAGAIAQSIERVKRVSNQLTVGPAASFSTRSNDTWLTSKVRSTLINTKYVPSRTILVTTDKGVVYLMGLVTQAEGDYAANATAGVSGVNKVVKSFDIISREEALRLSGNDSQQAGDKPAVIENSNSPAGSSGTGAAGAGGDGGLEIMPIQ